MDEALIQVRSEPQRYVLLFQDEVTFYRQPSQGWLWSHLGRQQPQMRYACGNNTRMRVVGYLNAKTGAVHAEEMPEVSAKRLARSVAHISSWYPQAETIYLVWDNWPNHKSPQVLEAIRKQPRVRLLWLPTYAPWLNAIEKLWRWLKQLVVHAHPWCDDFAQFRANVLAPLRDLASGSQAILQYVGMST